MEVKKFLDDMDITIESLFGPSKKKKKQIAEEKEMNKKKKEEEFKRFVKDNKDLKIIKDGIKLAEEAKKKIFPEMEKIKNIFKASTCEMKYKNNSELLDNILHELFDPTNFEYDTDSSFTLKGLNFSGTPSHEIELITSVIDTEGTEDPDELGSFNLEFELEFKLSQSIEKLVDKMNPKWKSKNIKLVWYSHDDFHTLLLKFLDISSIKPIE